MSLHFSDLYRILEREGVPTSGLVEADRLYSVAALATVTGIIAKTQFLRRRQYADEAWDCDDFAREAAMIARRLHADNPQRSAKAGLAFGVIYYTPASGGGHAINLFLYGKAGAEKVGFFEPQQSQVITLTRDEKLSVEHVDF